MSKRTKIENSLTVRVSGAAIIDAAIEAKKEEFSEKVIAFVKTVMDMRDRSQTQMDYHEKATKFFTAQLDAIAKNKFTLTRDGYLKFHNENLQLFNGQDV